MYYVYDIIHLKSSNHLKHEHTFILVSKNGIGNFLRNSALAKRIFSNSPNYLQTQTHLRNQK